MAKISFYQNGGSYNKGGDQDQQDLYTHNSKWIINPYAHLNTYVL